MADENKSITREDYINAGDPNDADQRAAEFDKMFSGAHADHYQQDVHSSQTNQNNGGKGTNKPSPEDEKGGEPKEKKYGFEDASKDWDPNETRPQAAEHYRFNSPHLRGRGHF